MTRDIPAIGGIGHVFEVFIPGAFLLLNFVMGYHLLPITPGQPPALWCSITDNSIIGITFIISFGYLLGVLLRILRSAYADELSGLFLRACKKFGLCQQVGGTLAEDKFPYTRALRTICTEHYPAPTIAFFDATWGIKGRDSRAFFNYCKAQILSEDVPITNEIYSAEAICRYISSMFYALAIATVLASIIVITNLIYSGSHVLFIALALTTYFLAMLIILRNYRIIRMKEVETIFAASFKNRHLFLTPSTEPDTAA